MTGLIGKTIGNYELVQQLGRGGMAVVYKAYQKPLQRYVAIKVLHADVASDETFLVRFQREAHSVARLRHPNIVEVHDFGVEAGLSYLVMELVAGPSLKQRLKALQEAGERMPHREVLHVIQGVASALGYAHTQGIIHRDVKPANIMLTAEKEGDAILTDFGLTRMLGASGLTGSGILGTPEYIAPEQGEGGQVDARSDLYSLGVVLYEMLVGRTPLEGETPLNMILKHVQGDLPLPRTLNADLSAEVEAVIMKALARAPTARYQQASDMVAALAQAMSLQLAGFAGAPTPALPSTVHQPHEHGRLRLISRQDLLQAVSRPPDPATSRPPAGPASALRLLVVHGPQQGLSIPLMGRIHIGRAPDNTFSLQSAQISRHHALIEVVGDQIRLSDLQSTNGTFVNQRRVSATYLREGDSVQLGDVTLLVQRESV